MAMKFTSKQDKAIRAAWASVETAVQASIQQERRLQQCLKIDMKHFGPVAGRAHLLHEIHRGLRNDHGTATLVNLTHEHDERILAFMVGVWIESRGLAGRALLADLNAARDAFTDAQTAHLESL